MTAVFDRCKFCSDPATVMYFCKAEGSDVRLCRMHMAEWQQEVVADHGLQNHCPNCATAYRARRDAQASNPLVTIADEPITGPLADAIEQAMLAEGVLQPIRQKILRRLAANTDSYVASVLARSAGSLV